jgi:hypothetical protein
LERIKQAGYQVKVQWKSEFGTSEDMKMEEHLPLRMRYAMFRGLPRPFGYITEKKRAKKQYSTWTS